MAKNVCMRACDERFARLTIHTCSLLPPPPICVLLYQLGTHLRGKKKREEMGNLLRKMASKKRDDH